MRTLPENFKNRLYNPMQVPAENANPSLDAWITRPTTQMVDGNFLEKQKIKTGIISALDVAVRHPKAKMESDRVFIGYVQSGTAKVVSSAHEDVMERHVWEDSGFSQTATDIALAFDSKTVRDDRDRHEYITEESPWVFWISDGALYGQILGVTGSPVTLAESSCTAVSAVRASYNEIADFDFGLCVFFLAGSLLMYRQYIHGTWYDAVTVTKLPEGVTFTDIAASRTWDYRICLQLFGSDTYIYELYSQYGGIGTRNQEHIEISNVTANGVLTEVQYTDVKSGDEHIEIGNVTANGALLYAYTATPVKAYNTDTDDGSGNYGFFVNVTFSHALHDAEGKNQLFTMTDTNGNIFGCISVKEIYNGTGLRLEFLDFNVAAKAESLTLTYTAPATGGVMSPVVPLESFTVTFVPENLIAPSVPAPAVSEVVNI